MQLLCYYLSFFPTHPLFLFLSFPLFLSHALIVAPQFSYIVFRAFVRFVYEIVIGNHIYVFFSFPLCSTIPFTPSTVPLLPFLSLHSSLLSPHHHTSVMRHRVHCYCRRSVPERPQGSNSCNTPDYTLSTTTATRNITPPRVGRMQGGLQDEPITGVETSLITPTADCQ